MAHEEIKGVLTREVYTSFHGSFGRIIIKMGLHNHQ